MSNIHNTVLGASAGIVFMLCVIFALDRCTPAVGAGNKVRVEKIVQVRVDTLRTIDTLLKKKVIYRDTGRIEYIHDDLNEAIPPIGDENISIAENQLRECMKCKDSLDAYKKIVAIDSSTIDTLAKIGKEKAPESGGLIHDLKVFGSGVLVGAGIRSFF